MFKFLKKKSIQNLKDAISTVFFRFPLSGFISVLAFALLVVIIYLENSLSLLAEDILIKVFITLIITFFFSTAIYLFSEDKGFKKAEKFYLQLFSFAFAFLFYIFFKSGLFKDHEIENTIYIILVLSGVACFLFTAGYLHKFLVRKINQNEFYVFVYTLILNAIMSGIVGGASLLLGFIALTSVFTLFDPSFIEESHWYACWAGFNLVLFAPFYFLANLADKKNLKNIEKISSNKLFSFLVNYVGVSAIFIYFLILYVYTIKVLINFSEWPQGEIAWMVVLFSFFGYAVYFASYAFCDTLKQTALFRKILPIAVAFQLPMLFYAIGLRINQYDLTINRYFIIVFGIWLAFLSLYYIFSKAKNFIVLFYSLLIVIIFISIGSWSVYNYPQKRQIARLEANLLKARILIDEKITPLSKYNDINPGLSSEIYGGIEYLCNFHGCEALDGFFADRIMEIKNESFKQFEKNQKEKIERLMEQGAGAEEIKKASNDEYEGVGNWEIINGLSEYIKVRKWRNENSEEEPRYLMFENNTNNYQSGCKISGYEYYVPMVMDEIEISNIISKQEKAGEQGEELFFAIVDIKEAKIRLYLKDKLLEEVSIQKSVINKILDNTKNYIEPDYYNPNIRAMLKNEDMSFQIAGKNYNMLAVFQSISVPNPSWTESSELNTQKNKALIDRQKTNTPYSSGYMLIKKK